MYGGGGALTVRFAPVVPWAKAGPVGIVLIHTTHYIVDIHTVHKPALE
jgi:hypothetical protein